MTERTNDPGIIEARLLELAYTTDAKITPHVLAYYANCSIEDAEQTLDRLVARDRISMEIEDDGTIRYDIPNREKLQPRREERTQPRFETAIIRRPTMALRPGGSSPALAALLSLVLPGAGQLYTGRPLAGLLWFVVVTAGYSLLLPGLILHLFCIASAASSANRLASPLYPPA
jgi:TM2 domain-containing membrane protein YozV